jgi:ParB/RepB/Spo0J family partition protein
MKVMTKSTVAANRVHDKPQSTAKPEDYQVQLLPVSQIFADADFNCRGHITPLDVLDLAKDIEKAGLQSPITVQPWLAEPGYNWRCVAGYRRLTAFKVNKTPLIPCFVRDDLSDLEAKKINLKENLLRKELNPVQEAKAILSYVVAGWTDADIAAEFEQSRGWVQIRRNILYLPSDIQKEVAAGIITQAQVLQLSRMKNPTEMYELVRKIKDYVDRGEKVKLDKPARKIASYQKKHRNPTEIYEMNEYLMELIGPCIATRVLAWAAGAISDIELGEDLRKYCTSNELPYTPHKAIEDVMS